ncbi:MAG TPA: hypothetical protein VFI46_13235, partial [Jiangellaceae bacterium]|nr:hypothetical protein [Jiangellaceae bacterium]
MGHHTRYEQRQLATTLRASARTWVDIATTLRAKWPELNARAAMRVAHGWNQSDAANAWNELWPDRPKSDKDVGLWEIRRPGFATLDRLARLYECSVADLVADIGDYRHLDTAGHRPATISVHSTTSEPVGTVIAVPQDERSRGHAQLAGEHDADVQPQAALSASTDFPLPDALAANGRTITPAELDGIEAIELVRRVEATDAGPRTLAAIAHGVDRLCSSYTHIAPADLLTPLRAHQGYVSRLLDGRATLTQRKELMRHAGWLSLLVATACIDLGYDRAAATNFRAARSLADETGDHSLAGWVLETQAWQALSNRHPSRAADLCRAGLDTTAPGTSAHVQLCTQLARVSARLGDTNATHRLVDECTAMADRMSTPEQAEHHFVCDPRRV